MESLWEKLVDGATDLASVAKEKGEEFVKDLDMSSISLKKEVNDAEVTNGKTAPLPTVSNNPVAGSSINYNMLMGAGIFLVILIVLLKK
jgi:hypothetical protein